MCMPVCAIFVHRRCKLHTLSPRHSFVLLLLKRSSVDDAIVSSEGEAGPLLCHGLDDMTARGGQGLRLSRPREATGGSGRDVPKYLPPRWPSECQVRSGRVSADGWSSEQNWKPQNSLIMNFLLGRCRLLVVCEPERKCSLVDEHHLSQNRHWIMLPN